ncbi:MULTISPECIES: DsrE/DsrF/TusD sulfur relay family protein [Ferrimonas]|uniref:DsrE/DsrF/TusD sulfur relay family protein n=1 Tax=Ferrimonas TaxID=44011 RepID=UPI0003FEF255|nr:MULTISPECIES: DsrE family protein [Ferrimonas]USD37389.1 DsrE family protein [Ferrimonas sp. SCSIO 43195]
MTSILMVAHDSPYGSEKLYNALRIALAMQEHGDQPLSQRVFLMSDAVVAALSGQQTPDLSYHIGQMIELLLAQGVPVSLCKTCAEARGLTEDRLIEGVQIGTLVELSHWTLHSDKVLHL